MRIGNTNPAIVNKVAEKPPDFQPQKGANDAKRHGGKTRAQAKRAELRASEAVLQHKKHEPSEFEHDVRESDPKFDQSILIGINSFGVDGRDYLACNQ